jgi:hypothetical protein
MGRVDRGDTALETRLRQVPRAEGETVHFIDVETSIGVVTSIGSFVNWSLKKK